MTKKTRTILFSICVSLFILIAPLAILYFQGYRFDFEKKRIVQTGGLYLKCLPKNAQIYLDGKLKEKTGIWSGSVLIENLLPKKYAVKIEKEGYHSWEKKLEIKEKQVTEAKNVVLIPKNPKFNVLATSTKDISNIISEINASATSSDKKRGVEYNDYEIWILFLENQYEQPQKQAGDRLFLTRFSEKIGEVFWLTDYYLVFNVGDKIKIAEIDDRDRINIVDLADFENPRIFFNKNDKKIYVLSNGVLYASKKLLP